MPKIPATRQLLSWSNGQQQFESYEIETLAELVRAVSDARTGGYEVDFTILPHKEAHRAGDGFFLVIEVNCDEPNPEPSINGQWWFFDDNTVMQVL